MPAELRDLITRRTAQVIDYQDTRLAGRFLDLVRRTAAHDDADRGWALTRAVTESWFKLLTYKDEYEVARLHLAADYGEVARDLGIDGPYSVTYHLHPPILRRLGMRKKLPLGTPYALAFRVLRPMRRVRGTPLDVFGWDRDRRTERAVIAEYERLMDAAIAAQTPYQTLGAAGRVGSVHQGLRPDQGGGRRRLAGAGLRAGCAAACVTRRAGHQAPRRSYSTGVAP